MSSFIAVVDYVVEYEVKSHYEKEKKYSRLHYYATIMQSRWRTLLSPLEVVSCVIKVSNNSIVRNKTVAYLFDVINKLCATTMLFWTS